MSTRSVDGSPAKSIVTAFLFAYLSTTIPKIATTLIKFARGRCDWPAVVDRIRDALRSGFKLNRFPAFCAAVIGGATALRSPFYLVLQSLDTKIHGGVSPKRTRNNRIAARFVAALLASGAGFRMLNVRSRERKIAVPGRSRASTETSVTSITSIGSTDSHEGKPPEPSKIPPGMPSLPARVRNFKPPVVALGVPLAGKTIDLTLFAAVRGADVLAQTYYATRPPQKRSSRWLADHASPILFALSSAIIMNAFFYAPSRLPFTYVKWIDRIAECDERLISVLQQAYYGNFVYGKETGIGPLLSSMAKDLGLPEEWGDPVKTIPVPCELVHHGVTKSCEKHAMWRFYRAWRLAVGVYAPLQAITLIQALNKRNTKRSVAIKRAIVDTARSSGFLGAFVSLFYYGVCLARTRVGPKLFSEKTVSRQMWDSGLCTSAGCALCGLSVLAENKRRQTELMLFVLPRALGAWLPRRYLVEHRWKEEATFAISMAVVLTAVQERPDSVRGVFGKILKQIMA